MIINIPGFIFHLKYLSLNIFLILSIQISFQNSCGVCGKDTPCLLSITIVFCNIYLAIMLSNPFSGEIHTH